MKKLLVIAVLSLFVATFASAELLVTANPFGKGKWVLEGAGLSDANVSNNSAYSAMTLGGYVGYGINEKLDVIAQVGQMTINGLPAGLSSQIMGLGLNFKYAVIEEGESMPVSVAVGAGYRSTQYTQSALLGGNASGNQMLIGVGVSKIIVPFVPYGGLAYRKSTMSGTDLSTQLDLTLGSAIAWSEQGAVLLEYTLQSITPNGGSNYTSGQIGLGVAYKI